MTTFSEDSSSAAWERFMRGEALGADVPTAILRSWERSRDAGVDPEHPVFRQISERELQGRLARAAALLEIAMPHLGWLSAALAPLAHAAYLVDCDGIVLNAVGEPAELRTRAGLAPGFDWSEQTMGTNGAGTALAQREPVAVLGGQHYCREWHDTTCVGAPIMGPGGELVGAVDLTTSVRDGYVARLPAVRHVAYTIERELALRHEVEQTRASELAERRARSRSERMSEAFSAFARALSPEQVVKALLVEGLAALEARSGALWVLVADGRSLELVGAEEPALRGEARATSMSLDAQRVPAEAVRCHEVVLFDSIQEWLHWHRDSAASLACPDGSCGAAPLRIGGMCIGALEFEMAGWHPLDVEERQLIEALGGQCAQALERARLFDAERAARGVAEAAVRARDELLALVSHHMRTPLAVIATSATLILDQLASVGATSEATSSQLLRISDACARMEALARNLLDLGRIDAGRTSPARTRCSLRDLLRQAVIEQEPLAQRRGQRLTWHTGEDLTIRCDGELTAHVLRNLIENAIKFSAAGAHIEVRGQRAGRHAHVCVVDQGPGIQRADLPHIFDRYFQAQGTKRRGVGLGLYIVRTFLEAQGSAIHADSTPGQGSRFCFELPLAEENA